MKAYGRRRLEIGCCPGHDNFPNETYSNRRSKRARARDNKLLHRTARARLKHELLQELRDLPEDITL